MMQFNKPIKATNITASNISASGGNIQVLSSNISSGSNTATWSSYNLFNKSGGTMTNFLQVSACNGNAWIGSSSNGGSFLSLAQGPNMLYVSSMELVVL
jgi:hypothetical protein